MAKMVTVEIKDGDGRLLGISILGAKTFSTGSTGFYGSDKISMEDGRYQCAFSMIKIGSKPAADTKKDK